MSNIPLIDVKTQNQELKAEIMEALSRVYDSGAFILGPEVKEFENEFRNHTGVHSAIACASGSDALLLPLMAEEVGHGDEVLVPSFTFYATAGAVARLGARPVFVDSDETYNICLKDLAAKITPKTKAIIPMHLYGYMTDMPELLKIRNSGNKRIPVIEDCAQSIGASMNGQQAGTFAEYGAYSFYPTKNLGAMGDAGMVSASNAELAEKIQMIRVHGSKQRYYHELVGVNSRLDSMQAAILRIKLRKLKSYEEKRAKLASEYEKVFAAAGLAEFVKLPIYKKERKHVWNQFTIRAKDRDGLKQFLAEKGIGTEIYYPLAMHKQKAFQTFIDGPVKLPVCESLEREAISLPMFPELTLESVGKVVSMIDDFYRRGKK